MSQQRWSDLVGSLQLVDATYEFVPESGTPKRLSIKGIGQDQVPIHKDPLYGVAVSYDPPPSDLFRNPVPYWFGPNGPVAADFLMQRSPAAKSFHLLGNLSVPLDGLRLLLLPWMLLQRSAHESLPDLLPTHQWASLARETSAHGWLELELAYPDGSTWKGRFFLDDSIWPKTVEVLSTCVHRGAFDCHRVPAQPGRWQRVQVIPVQPWVIPHSRPVDARTDSVSAFPLPTLDPGGNSPSLARSIEYAKTKSQDFRTFVANHPSWYVHDAHFSGSNLTGRTTWKVQVGEPGYDELFRLTVAAENGNIDMMLGSASIEWQTVNSKPDPIRGSDRTVSVPRIEKLALLPLPCESPETQLVEIHYLLGLYPAAPEFDDVGNRRDGSTHVRIRGVGPDCSGYESYGFFSIYGATKTILGVSGTTRPLQTN